MRQPDRRFRIRDTILLSGWLFADLLLALTVIFLSANTVGVKPQPIATPIPTPTAIPSPPPRLELDSHPITVTIDPDGLLGNSPTAINDLKQKIRNQDFLKGRTAGLVIAYGGARNGGDTDRATKISKAVMRVLQLLGNEGFAFTRTSYYKPVIDLSINDTTTTIDVFLFAQ